MTDHPPNQEEIYTYLNIVLTYLRTTEQENVDLERVLTDSLHNASFTNDVLTEQEERLLLIEQPYDPQSHTTTMCPILQSPFERNEPITVLPCNHVFNPEAIRTWLKEHNALCPVCRYNLKSTTGSNTTEYQLHDLTQEEDETPPLTSNTIVDIPIENIFIYEYPIHVEPYISFRSTETLDNDYTIYYNIYYHYRNNTLPTENTLLHIQ